MTVVNPIGGAGYLFRGMRLITRPGLRRFVVMPLLVNRVVPLDNFMIYKYIIRLDRPD